MRDVFSRRKRSEIMRAVKSKGNKSTELSLQAFFRENKIKEWRRKSKLVGKPDFVFPQMKIAVFADGCFWHGHKCRNTTPQTNAKYWSEKLKKNRRRDASINRELAHKGWKVLRIWECQIRRGKVEKHLSKLFRLASKGKLVS